MNLAPPAEDAEWRQLVSQPLGNGDNIQVVVEFKWPSVFADNAAGDLYRVQKRIIDGDTAKGFEGWRESEKAKDWAGRAVAEVLDYDLTHDGARKQIRRMLKIWIENKALKIVERRDKKRMSKNG